MESEDVARLAAALKACPTLKTLKLTGNEADTHAAARALAEGLADLPQLETCHLPVLGEEGAEVFVPALQPLRDRGLKNVIPSPFDVEMAARLRSMPPGVDGG